MVTMMYGMSEPMSMREPEELDLRMTRELESCLRRFDLFETDQQMEHRMYVLGKINELAQRWIRDVSASRNYPLEFAATCQAKIFTFGSYRLGVHTRGADIDTLLVAPRHVERTDFFRSFQQMLRELPGTEYVRSVEEAFVPVIKTKVDGIELDILFARLNLRTIPPEQGLSDSELLRGLDSATVRSLNGCRVTDDILHLVPNHDAFRLALRAIKLWAKKRGIYSNVLGYLGGVSWAMLVARTCQLYPRAVASTIVSKFFFVFQEWPWPRPVILNNANDGTSNINLGFPVWDPRTNPSDRYHVMPIITPSYPQQNSTFNVTRSTKSIMTNEIKAALQTTTDIMRGVKRWDALFEPIDFFHSYKHFIVLLLSSQPEWVGLVESKIRILVQSLEHHSVILLVHTNPEHFKRVIEISQPPAPATTEQQQQQDSSMEEQQSQQRQELGEPNNQVSQVVQPLDAIIEQTSTSQLLSQSDNSISMTSNTGDTTSSGLADENKAQQQQSESLVDKGLLQQVETEEEELRQQQNHQPEQVATGVKEEQTMWFIGLEFNRSQNTPINVNLGDDITGFTNAVERSSQTLNSLYKPEELKIEVRYVRRKELPKYLPPETLRASNSPNSTANRLRTGSMRRSTSNSRNRSAPDTTPQQAPSATTTATVAAAAPSTTTTATTNTTNLNNTTTTTTTNNNNNNNNINTNSNSSSSSAGGGGGLSSCTTTTTPITNNSTNNISNNNNNTITNNSATTKRHKYS